MIRADTRAFLRVRRAFMQSFVNSNGVSLDNKLVRGLAILKKSRIRQQ
jgi:hypothetical protein